MKHFPNHLGILKKVEGDLLLQDPAGYGHNQQASELLPRLTFPSFIWKFDWSICVLFDASFPVMCMKMYIFTKNFKVSEPRTSFSRVEGETFKHARPCFSQILLEPMSI